MKTSQSEEATDEFLGDLKEIFDFFQRLLIKNGEAPNEMRIEFSLEPAKVLKYNDTIKELISRYSKLRRNLKFTVENVLDIDYQDYLELLDEIVNKGLSEKEVKARIEELASQNEMFIDLTDTRKPPEARRNRITVEGKTFNEMTDQQNGMN